MSWRVVVVSNSAKLDFQLGYLIVRQSEVTKIHLSEISVLLIESTAVSMTAYLLSELIKKKIKVIFCDEKRNPASELVPFYGSHDTSLKMRKQIEWAEDIKTAVWTEIVAEKIKKQAEVLQFYGLKEYEMLLDYVEELQPGDSTNREGHAAKVYFNALFGKNFSRTDENSVNAALNYGYGIILSAFNREIAVNGYSTQLGLFHQNMFNQFNLSSDLMEPFRPVVDIKVKKLQPDKFQQEEKMKILGVLNEEVVIGGRKEYINNAIKIYVRSVFDALNDRNPAIIKFYRNEL